MTEQLCHRSDCHHPESAHTKLAGCTVENAGDATHAHTICRCEKFTPAPDAETTGRTIPSRTSDPDTSHKAANAILIKAGSQRTRLLQSFAGLTDATDEEAMENATGVTASSEYAKRCSELREAGYIEATGAERVGGSGQSRIVCQITKAGEDALLKAGHAVPNAPLRRRVSRLTSEDTHLVDRLRHLTANPNGVDGRVVLLNATAADLVTLLERLA